MSAVEPYFMPFDECKSYTQQDAEGLSFRKVLPFGVLPNVDIGLVTGEGPTHKFAGTHTEWDQCYIVFEGTGYIHLNDKKIRIDRPGIVYIPIGTKHSIEVDHRQTMQYIYINRYVDSYAPEE